MLHSKVSPYLEGSKLFIIISGQNYYNASNYDISLTIFHAELNLYRTIAGQKLEAGKGVG